MATVKEKDLPQVTSLTDADFIRAVSSVGESEIVNYQTIRQRIVSEVLEEITSMLPSIETATPNITAGTGGTLTDKSVTYYGKVAILRFTVTNSASVAAGANIATATLQDFRPRNPFNLVGYYGSHSLVGYVNTSGVITVRNASSEAVSITTGTALSGAYIMA